MNYKQLPLFSFLLKFLNSSLNINRIVQKAEKSKALSGISRIPDKALLLQEFLILLKKQESSFWVLFLANDFWVLFFANVKWNVAENQKFKLAVHTEMWSVALLRRTVGYGMAVLNSVTERVRCHFYQDPDRIV